MSLVRASLSPASSVTPVVCDGNQEDRKETKCEVACSALGMVTVAYPSLVGIACQLRLEDQSVFCRVSKVWQNALTEARRRHLCALREHPIACELMGDDLREDLSALTSQQITQRYKKVNEAIEDIRDVTILSLDVIRWGNEQAIRVLHAMAHQLRLPVPTDKPMHDCKEHITFLRGVDIAQTKKFGRFFELVQEYTSNGKALKEKELIAQRLKPECHIDNPIALLALGRIYMRGRSVEKDEQKAETFFIAATCQVFKIWEEVEKMPIPPQRVSDLRDVVFHRVHCEYMKREEMEKRILTNLFL